MKRTRRIKGFLAAVICAVMLVGNAATVMAASAMQLGQYFQVSVGIEIEAGRAANNLGGIIDDWNQFIPTNTLIGATLSYRDNAPDKTVVAPPVTYTWKLTKGNNSITLTGRTIRIPAEYSGGDLLVEASTTGNKNWAKSAIRLELNIS